MIELDYHHTSDGVPVVLHDPTLDRATDALERWGGRQIAARERSLSELRELEAGLWFQPPQPGLRIPTLAEALELIQLDGITLIERKAGDAATCVELLRQQNLINRVVAQAFDWNYLRDFHRIEPRQILGALGPPGSRDGQRLSEEEKQLSASWLDEMKSFGAQVAVWNSQVDASSIKAAHQRGLKVWVYTINEAGLAEELLNHGVDGIITDNPSLIWRVLALRGAKLTPGPPS